MVSAAIVVVSDTCFQDRSQDTCGPKLADKLNQSGIASKAILCYVPDLLLAIQKALLKLVNDDIRLVVTTGGTGFSNRDVTPEAVKPLLEKEAPGIVIRMMTSSLAITDMAALGRPVAGTLRSTLIVTLPGSVKGAIENLDSIIDILPHALQLLGGVNSRELHKDFEKHHGSNHNRKGSKSSANTSVESGNSGGCRHQHHHHHDSKSRNHSHSVGQDKDHQHQHQHHHGHGHDGPKFFGVTTRDRTSPYEMIPFGDAIEKVLNSVPHNSSQMTTTVPLEDSVGYVISEDIYAVGNVPHFRASIVDGYAVHHSVFENESTVVLPVLGASLASSQIATSSRESCVRVTTGAPIPSNSTAVIPVENTKLVKEQDDVELEVEITAPGVKNGDNVREIGSDIKMGSLIIKKDTFISSFGGEIGALASVGMRHIPVYKKPVVGVMSTGDEVYDVGTELKDTCIWDSNRLMIISNLKKWLPAENVVDLGIVKDVKQTLHDRVKGSFARVDILITSGGVSMGETDFLKPVIKELNGDLKFGRVNMKPGKPVTFATFKDNKTIFALPGNPVSCVVCLNLFAKPFIMKYSGYPNCSGDWVEAQASENIRLDVRPEFQRGVLKQVDGKLVWHSTGFQRSSYIKSMVNSNCLAMLPGATKEKPELIKGETFKVLIM